jgi:hypothetical protein
MNGGIGITIYLSSALVAGVLAGAVAPAKKRHQGYWTVFSFLCPPVVVILLLLPRGNSTYYAREPRNDSLD